MRALRCRRIFQPLRVAASAALLFTAGYARADYPTAVMGTPNLVGYWQFESATQADSSVNGYTGTFVGNAAIGDAGSGPALLGIADNRAALFDGNGDCVHTNLAGQVTFPTAATIVAWVHLDIQPSTAGRILYIAGRSWGGNDLDMQIDGGDNRVRFYTDSYSSVAAPATLPLHQWIMLAGTFDTALGVRALYIDGKPVASDVPGGHSADSALFFIGCSSVWENRWFQGRIDEVAIFDRALTAAEIGDLEDAAGDLVFRTGFEY